MDAFNVKGPDGITRSLSEHYDGMKDVEQDPYGAWLAIQNQATRIEALEAQVKAADALAEALTQIANAPSEMTWGEEAEVNETMNKMEAIADAALAKYRAPR